MAIIATWIAMVIGVLVLVHGVITLAIRRIIWPWLRARMTWRLYGWSQVCFGSSVLLDTIPPVAGASAGLRFLLSGVAFLPIIAGIVCVSRAKLRSPERPTQFLYRDANHV